MSPPSRQSRYLARHKIGLSGYSNRYQRVEINDTDETEIDYLINQNIEAICLLLWRCVVKRTWVCRFGCNLKYSMIFFNSLFSIFIVIWRLVYKFINCGIMIGFSLFRNFVIGFGSCLSLKVNDIRSWWPFKLIFIFFSNHRQRSWDWEDSEEGFTLLASRWCCLNEFHQASFDSWRDLVEKAPGIARLWILGVRLGQRLWGRDWGTSVGFGFVDLIKQKLGVHFVSHGDVDQAWIRYLGKHVGFSRKKKVSRLQIFKVK